jgi:prepilin-type N-terminal cleavage/methylation domain-containing protein
MKNQRGFTLIELSLVITLTAFLLSFVTINLMHSQQKVSMNAAEQVLFSDLRQQQIKAMIGDTEGRSSANAYGIHFDSDKYVLFYGSTYSASDSANFTVNMSNNIQFDNPGFNIIFLKLSGELSTGSSISAVLRDTTNGITKTVTINKYGVVTGED